MNTCITCGMPFEGNHTNDIGLQTADGPVCKFDSENGQIKAPELIFAGGIEFFKTYTDGDLERAERVTRTNMKHLAYWTARPFALLDGPEATEEEFATAMAKM